MIITDMSKESKKVFGSLNVSDVFMCNGQLFMKTSHSGEDAPNAFNFSLNKMEALSAFSPVDYIPSELVLHDSDWEKQNLVSKPVLGTGCIVGYSSNCGSATTANKLYLS